MAENEFTRTAFDGKKLFFRCWSTETRSKGLICLVHGLGEHSGRYTQWSEMLNKAGYNVLSYDLRGHGKSSGKRGHVSSFLDYVRDTDILVEEGVKKFPGMPSFLYGHSLGGIIVVNYVLRRKPKLNGVVITALSNRSSLQEQKAKVIFVKILGAILPGLSMSSGLVPATISRDPGVVNRYIEDPLVHHQVSLAWGKSALETITWIDQHANEWSLPVLFMHGEKDALGFPEGSREYSSKIKGDCNLKIWPELFHEIHNEPEKQEVFDYLLIWLNAHLL